MHFSLKSNIGEIPWKCTAILTPVLQGYPSAMGSPNQCIIRADKPISMFLPFAEVAVWEWGSCVWVPCLVTILEWFLGWQLRMRTCFSRYKLDSGLRKAHPCVTNGPGSLFKVWGVNRSLTSFFLQAPEQSLDVLDSTSYTLLLTWHTERLFDPKQREGQLWSTNFVLVLCDAIIMLRSWEDFPK